jgi:hypothetical protein
MVYIYVLKLENNKYYIGKTNNPTFRLENHFSSNGSAWTKKYKPIKVEELIHNCDDYDEDKYTKIYMDKFGISNVRGGSYSSVNLDEKTINHLQRMSNGTNNNCFICGLNGHFANKCTNKLIEQNEEYEEVWCCEHCDKEYLSESECLKHEKQCVKYKQCSIKSKPINCYRCGREGHYANSCYAKTNIDGEYISRFPNSSYYYYEDVEDDEDDDYY